MFCLTLHTTILIISHGSCACQAYEERRRKKDAERETAEAAEEAELARAAAARYAKQEAEAAEWMGQISVEEQGQEADDQQEGQVKGFGSSGHCTQHTVQL